MTLDELLARKDELEKALQQTEQSYWMIKGHMAEIDYQSSLVIKKDEEIKENQDASPVLDVLVVNETDDQVQ